MKPKILLLDDSLTVQKVVALSLDRAKYQVLFAKSPQEAIRSIHESEPRLVLVSENVLGPNASSFPKEVELRLGKERHPPPMILIAARPNGDQKHYSGVLIKPFTPQALEELIRSNISPVPEPTSETDGGGEERLHQIFNNAFPHESDLVKETFVHAEAQANVWGDREPSGDALAPLWDNLEEAPVNEIKTPVESQKAASNRSTPGGDLNNLDELIAKRVDLLLPGIVERLVQERLDKLLNAVEDAETSA